MELLKYTTKYIHHIGRRLALGILLLVISTCLSIGNPILIGKYIDMLSVGNDIHYIIHSAIVLVSLWIASMIISYVNSVNATHMNIRLAYNINFHLLQHAERLPYAILANMDTIYLNNRIHNDSSVLASFFLNSFLTAIVQSITCLIVTGVIFFTDPFIGILILLLLPLYMLFYMCFKSTLEKSSKDMMESRDVFSGEMQKQLRYIRTIKLNAWYERLYASLIREFIPVYRTAIKNIQINSLYSLYTQVIQIIANIIIFLVCGIAVSRGSMKLGSLITVNSLFSILFSSFTSLMDFGKSHAIARAAFSRVKDLEMQAEEKNGELVSDQISEIRIKDLTFHYPENDKILLDHVSLEFVAGKIYQIRGENGCGKSTLIDFVLGLHETHGKVYFNGVPIESLDMRTMRQEVISIVEQEPPLIFRTVSENILNSDIDNSELMRRIYETGLNDLAGNLDIMSDRNIFDGANNLSGGERQKVAILHALLKDFRILILDEPVSALDSQSCKQLKNVLTKMKHNRIIIIVDHQSVFSDIVDVNYTICSGKIIQSYRSENNSTCGQFRPYK